MSSDLKGVLLSGSKERAGRHLSARVCEKPARRESAQVLMCAHAVREEQGPVTVAASRGGRWVTGPRVGRRMCVFFFSLNSRTSKGSGEKPSSAFDQLCDLGLVT